MGGGEGDSQDNHVGHLHLCRQIRLQWGRILRGQGEEIIFGNFFIPLIGKSQHKWRRFIYGAIYVKRFPEIPSRIRFCDRIKSAFIRRET